MADFSDKGGFIWMDGRMVPWREAQIHVLTSSLHYGTAVFEGIRAYQTERGSAIFRLEDHIRRFEQSAHILEMTLPYDTQTLIAAHRDIVRVNQLESGYIRPIAFYGSESMGLRAADLKAHVAIAAWSWGSYLGDADRAVRVGTSSYSRMNVNAAMCRAKASGHYINSVLASKEAAAHGYDEALLLDAYGFVMEGPGENVFLLRNGVIYTPELTSCLEGITRHTVIHLLKAMGLEVVEKRITRDEVYISDEAFFTGTAAEIVAIGEVDRRKIGDGAVGKRTREVQKAYFDLIQGENAESPSHWLTYV